MNRRKAFLWVIVLLEWPAWIVQLILHLRASPAPTGEALVRFFSFFTILTNLLVGVYAAALLFPAGDPRHRTHPAGDPHTHPAGGIPAGDSRRPSAQTAVAVYITIVGLIYNLVLRGLWHSGPLQAVLHDLLHTVIPLLFIIYWRVWVDARSLRYADILPWLIYPALYCLFVLVRGSYTGWYPYPFMDVNVLGGWPVFRNCLGITVVFVLFPLLFVYWGRRKWRGHRIRRH